MHKRYSPHRGMKATRNVVLTPQQVRSLLDATATQAHYRDLHDAVRIILRSGIRSTELARLRWADFEFGLRVMRIEDRKTGCGHVTIMDPETVAVLQARHELAGDAEFVLGKFPCRALARATRQYRHLAKKLALPARGLHMLRGTVRAAASEQQPEGASLHNLLAVAKWTIIDPQKTLENSNAL